MQIFKKDNYIFGALLGLIIPAIIYGLILMINLVLVQSGIVKNEINLQTHLLISFAVNLLAIRYYFVNLKYDKTGRGLLLITFILFMLFFVLKNQLQ